MAEIFAIISAVLVLIGAPFYLVDILKGTTKPERATWFIWSILGSIAFFSQRALGAHWSLLYAGIDALGSIIVFALSLKYGVGGWSLLDRIALFIALIGVGIAYYEHRPILAILGIMLADSAGAILTIRKTYTNPQSETSITWFGIGTSSLFGALSVGSFRPALLLYPIYLTLGAYSVLLAKNLGKLAELRRSVHPSG
jgi:hypothetical protein